MVLRSGVVSREEGVGSLLPLARGISMDGLQWWQKAPDTVSSAFKKMSQGGFQLGVLELIAGG